jgi:hypothetical protein
LPVDGLGRDGEDEIIVGNGACCVWHDERGFGKGRINLSGVFWQW